MSSSIKFLKKLTKRGNKSSDQLRSASTSVESQVGQDGSGKQEGEIAREGISSSVITTSIQGTYTFSFSAFLSQRTLIYYRLRTIWPKTPHLSTYRIRWLQTPRLGSSSSRATKNADRTRTLRTTRGIILTILNTFGLLCRLIRKLCSAFRLRPRLSL
jgi:hypothetical protein